MRWIKTGNSFRAGSAVMVFRSLYSACTFMRPWRWFKFVAASKLWRQFIASSMNCPRRTKANSSWDKRWQSALIDSTYSEVNSRKHCFAFHFRQPHPAAITCVTSSMWTSVQMVQIQLHKNRIDDSVLHQFVHHSVNLHLLTFLFSDSYPVEGCM